MKHFGSIVGKSAAYAVALLAASVISSLQAQTQQGSATAFDMKGSADYSVGGGTWSPLRGGTELKAGATVRTGADSRADLDLKINGPTVRLAANTTLGIDKLLYEKTGVDNVIETQLDLKAGTIAARVDKSSASSKYEVKTPNAVVGVRGAAEVAISADGKTAVKTGSAVVVHVDSSGKTTTFVVNGGQSFDPTVPGVRPGTQPELDSVTPPRQPAAGVPVVLYEPSRIPYVSEFSPKDAVRGD